MSLDLEKLEGLAKAATPGPWMTETYEGDSTVMPAWLCQHERWPIATGIGTCCADMAYIAGANPAAVLALIEEVRALRAVAAAATDCVMVSTSKSLYQLETALDTYLAAFPPRKVTE